MQKSLIFFWGGRLNCLTLRKIILLKTVKGFCCLMQEIKNGIDRTHLKFDKFAERGFFGGACNKEVVSGVLGIKQRKMKNEYRISGMRKFVLTLAALPAVLLAGCKQESNYNNITLDKYALEMRTGDTQIVYVETGDPDNVAWRSDNEFVATVERGRISGLRIGQTRITANNASVSVTVRGRSDLYDEPMEDLSWNMTREQVVNRLGLPDKMENNVLTYDLVSSVNSFKSYEFDSNNRLVAANITVGKDKTAQLDDFLNERYLLLNGSEQGDKNYINNLTYSTSTMTVCRTGYDDDYWLVSYRQIK